MPTVTRFGLALPLTPLAVGQTFSLREWPLHVTVLPNCSGSNGDVPVTVLTAATAVEALQWSLVDALADLVELETPQHSREGYRPHVTHLPGVITGTGSVARLIQLALVDIDSDGRGLRKVAAVADFGDDFGR